MQKKKIAICDDSNDIRQIVKEHLDEYGKLRKIEFEMMECDSGESLKGNWKEDCSILLLDIDLPGMDGIEAAENLMDSYDMNNCRIIVLSGVPERFQETYHIKANDFVTKPIDKRKLFYAIDRAIRDLDFGEKLEIIFDGQKLIIAEKDIQYIECKGNSCYYHTKFGVGNSYITIKECEEKLSGKWFFKCHRSYLVNLFYVKRILSNDVLLKNDTKIPMSRLRRKAVYSALSDYRFQQ